VAYKYRGVAKGGMARSPDLLREDIDIMFATNVTGLINMTQAILPIFLKRENGGRGDIINLNSIAGREAYVGGSIYCATKAAVRSYTDTLRRELISSRIRVIEIAPGQVETEFSVVRFGGDKEKADKVYEGVEPLTPEDVAEVIVFAASRRENVVVADVLLYPSHQVCGRPIFVLWFSATSRQSPRHNIISMKAILVFRKVMLFVS
jgi:3-hydroxy acid dehydrogenase / malonic semialdehyde reductase